MKKHRLLIPLLLLLLLPGGCAERSTLSFELGVDLTAGTVEERYDDHGGFHGDGRTYTRIRFDAAAGERLTKAIGENAAWQSLPLPDGMGKAAKNALPPKEGFPFPLLAQSGSYLLIDRQGGDTDVLTRASSNYSLALYDAQEGVLYYVALDT